MTAEELDRPNTRRKIENRCPACADGAPTAADFSALTASAKT